MPSPTPCSPLHEPPNASARATIFRSNAQTRSNPSGSGGTRITVWKFPSPTCPTMGAVSPEAMISSFAPMISSVIREIGTMASVATPFQPGCIASAAQYASWRAFQSRFRSSALVAHWNPCAPCSPVISCASAACSATAASVP